MPKFNTKTKNINKTVNHAGGEAYKLSSEMELYSAVVTSILSDTFYEKENDRLSRLRKLIKHSDPQFVAQLAVYARTQMYLRTLPVVLLVELAHIHNGDTLVRRLANKVLLRVDEITEALSYYAVVNNRKDNKRLGKISNQLKAGIGDRFNAFDEYQFAKYNRAGAVKLRDALFITHPIPKDDAQKALFDKIVEDNLAIPYTWETELSKVGEGKYETDEEKEAAIKKVWQELIKSGKLGYMALLRNLRAILEAGVDYEYIEMVAERLGDADAVRKARQFPFRFMSAYQMVENLDSVDAPSVLDALERAMVVSAENISGFGSDTKVFISNDVSGSMDSTISPRSIVARKDVGLILGMLLQSRCARVVTSVFGETFAVKNFPKTNIIQNALKMRNFGNEVGHSTNGHLAVEYLLDEKLVMDKVMIFTDCQLWDSWGTGASLKNSWKKYKKIAPNAKLYLFDLAGYGTSPLDVNSDDVYLVAGWSDKIFDMLTAYENGGSAIEEIKRIEV